MFTFSLNDETTQSLTDSVASKLIEIIQEKMIEKIQTIELIDGEEMCNRFGITLGTLQKWRDRKEIPYIQIGSVIRYDFNKIIQLKETKRKR